MPGRRANQGIADHSSASGSELTRAIAAHRVERMTHLITGATGNIGGRVVEGLVARGERPRVFVRDPARARARFGERVDIAVGDLADPKSLANAFAGVETLFLLNSGPQLGERDAAAAQAARAADLKRLVKLSSLGAR